MTIYRRPSIYLPVSHPLMQPTSDQKYSREKNSREFQKQNLNLPCANYLHGTFICHYLHSIYTVLGILSRLERI